jgi:signal transduction histidine kinase
MRRALTRLRWQLTLSHLVATTFTLVCMIAAAVLIVTIGITVQNKPNLAPAEDARTVARSIGGMVTGEGSADLNAVLRRFADGSLRVVDAEQDGPPWAPVMAGTALKDIAYIVVIGPDGRTLGSSDPAGAAFAPPERAEWQGILADAQAGERDLGELMMSRTGEGPAALGAYPVFDGGRQIASVVVAKTSLSTEGSFLNFWRALAIFGVATVAVLSAASVFALASASVVAYLLSRRLVARLERLGGAAEALASGDLSRRVEEGRADEVGRLAHQFNLMAADLERTLRERAAERDRVTGLLEARRQLVAGVSHELRTPVATIRGYIEAALARGENVPANLRTELETMEREIARLQRLIEDLFTLSRAEVGRLELRLEPTDAGAVVQRLVETTAPLAWTQRRVEVLAEVAPDVPLAQADAQRLEQIVSNLLSNAVRHTPPGGLVAAAVSAEPGSVLIEVRDTGEGIPPDDLPRIFERFYRGRNGDGRAGAGLGLALSKELAEAMGGSVEAASTAGEGSCFTVRLPLAQAAAPVRGGLL